MTPTLCPDVCNGHINEANNTDWRMTSLQRYFSLKSYSLRDEVDRLPSSGLWLQIWELVKAPTSPFNCLIDDTKEI